MFFCPASWCNNFKIVIFHIFAKILQNVLKAMPSSCGLKWVKDTHSNSIDEHSIGGVQRIFPNKDQRHNMCAVIQVGVVKTTWGILYNASE